MEEKPLSIHLFVCLFVLIYKPWETIQCRARWPCSLENAGLASLSPRLALEPFSI